MKLKYMGHLSKGIAKLPNGGELSVIKGQEYDIKESDAEKLLQTGFWKKVEKKEVKTEVKNIDKKIKINKFKED